MSKTPKTREQKLQALVEQAIFEMDKARAAAKQHMHAHELHGCQELIDIVDGFYNARMTIEQGLADISL